MVQNHYGLDQFSLKLKIAVKCQVKIGGIRSSETYDNFSFWNVCRLWEENVIGKKDREIERK